MIQKFRAWDKDLEIMSYTGNNLILQISKNGIQIAYYDSFHEITNYELSQSTGLLDKNGTEIYEGDILKWHGIMGHGWFEDVQDVVIYDKQELRFKFKNRNEDIKNIVNIGVIVGNIYEHPHLLGED